jgi:hypothetical protein
MILKPSYNRRLLIMLDPKDKLRKLRETLAENQDMETLDEVKRLAQIVEGAVDEKAEPIPTD